MTGGERHKKICQGLDIRSEEKREAGKGAGQFFVRSTREKATRRWRPGNFTLKGLSSATGESGVPTRVDATCRRRAHGVEMRNAQRIPGDIMSSERWSEWCDEMIRQGNSGLPVTHRQLQHNCNTIAT
jgi:hypothetical protein